MASSDEVVEKPADHSPHREVEAGCWRNPAKTAKKHRKIDLSPNAVLLLSAKEPHPDRGNGAEQESPNKRSVQCSRPEKPRRTNYTPQNASVEMNPGDWAIEAVDGLRRADTRDKCQHPVQDANLSKAGNNRGRELEREKQSRWDFHVVAKFKVRREFQALSGCDISICHKHHVRNRSSRKHYTADELTNEVKATLLVGDRHHDADRNEEEGANSQSEQKTVPRQVNGVTGIKSGAVRSIAARETYYSTTNMPIAVMATPVKRYHDIGASLYLLISRLWTSSTPIMLSRSGIEAVMLRVDFLWRRERSSWGIC